MTRNNSSTTSKQPKKGLAVEQIFYSSPNLPLNPALDEQKQEQRALL